MFGPFLTLVNFNKRLRRVGYNFICAGTTRWSKLITNRYLRGHLSMEEWDDGVV